MRVFVDTNVLIDYVCNRTDFYEDAESLFSLGLAKDIDILFSDISVINTLYVGKKYGYTTEELTKQLQMLLGFCEISNTDGSVVLNALNSTWIDKEDAMQYYSAKASLADIIITRNVKDFSLAEIRITTPSDFLK